eukprot:UN08214
MSGKNQYPAEGATAFQPSAPPAYVQQPISTQPQQNYAAIPQQQVQPQPGYPAAQQPIYAQQPPPQVVVVPTQQGYQQGYKPPQQAQQVVIVQPTSQVQPAYPRIISRYPQQCYCPRCQKLTQTRTMYVPGLGTWAVAGGVCLVGCWLGCCLIPFCIDDLKDVEHSCSICGNFVGSYKVIR